MINKLTVLVAGLAIVATTVIAANHDGPFAAQITARQSHMRLNAYNLGILGRMAQSKIAYDADAAAANLVALASISQATYWPQGSDSFDYDGTAAMPDIWDNLPDLIAKNRALAAAAADMSAAAGGGLGALQAAIGPLGGACGACHKAYRQPK